MLIEKEYTQKISISHRKKYAQFFTPEPIAQIMVDWLLGNPKLSTLLEPAFGLGIFSRLLMNKRKDIQITSFDIDPVIYQNAKDIFKDYSNIKLYLEDYLLNDWNSKYDTIICNPPYFKFHDYENKKTLEKIKSKLNVNLSGFTNIYSLFLLKSIYQLKKNGRAVYIIPSEFLNSDYGRYVKNYLLKSNTLRHIFIFDFKENVFEDAMTTSAILFMAKDENSSKINFSTISNIEQLSKIPKIINEYPKSLGEITISSKDIDPNIKWRSYYQKQQSINYKNLIPFKRIAKVVRGIATGANDYFVFNTKKAIEFNIKKTFLLPCITKSKDITKPFFTKDDFEKLKLKNANIFLFNAEKNTTDKYIQDYINLGEKKGINEKYLTSKRKPWFSIENRPPSPIWVGVFNRNGIKFIRNEAEICNLTTFHCIYLVNDLFSKIDIDLLFAYLLTDTAKRIFSDNRREYGNGLKKFEPNDLNNALMLDLSILTSKHTHTIINLYNKYRTSLLANKEDISYINQIDRILIEEYGA